MGIFKHPHLVRGVVHTVYGAFVLNRGVAVLPDDVGRALGWQRLEDGAHSDAGQAKVEANLSTGRS